MKHAYLVSKSKGKLSQFIQNQLMITVDKLDDNWCESAFQSLKDGNVKVLVGYPSAIARLASYVLNRSEEHTSELQSRPHLVCRLLLEKKKKKSIYTCLVAL